MTPCSSCFEADRGFNVHCGRCGCCAESRVNWAFVAAVVIGAIAWVAIWRTLHG